jgi:hypothetical protein
LTRAPPDPEAEPDEQNGIADEQDEVKIHTKATQPDVGRRQVALDSRGLWNGLGMSAPATSYNELRPRWAGRKGTRSGETPASLVDAAGSVSGTSRHRLQDHVGRAVPLAVP